MLLTKKLVDQLLQKGAEKAQVTLVDKKEEEFSMESGDFSLLRTNFNKSLNFKMIKDNKQATVTCNKMDEESLNKSMTELFELCESSPKDDSYDISDFSGEHDFAFGSKTLDRENATKYLSEFTDTVKEQFPKISIRDTGVKHVYLDVCTSTSAGLFAKEGHGYIEAFTLFTAQEGKNVTSMNFAGGQIKNMDKAFLNCFDTKIKLQDSQALLNAENLGESFTGDVIATPGAMSFLTGFLMSNLRDGKMISNTSYLKDKKGKKVVSDLFSMSVLSQSDELVSQEYLTRDNFLSKDYKIFENGVLNHYLLGQYGAKKTNLEQTYNNGSLYKINPGATPYKKMVESMDKGIIIGYMSAGMPSTKGDFSGVAKNSFYVENGKIVKPLKEVMISGNVFDMFENITSISAETLNSGTSITPWIKFPNVSICLLYTSPSPRDQRGSRMPSSA